jgi:hypothetical protein
MTRIYSKIFFIGILILIVTNLFLFLPVKRVFNNNNKKIAQRFLLTDLCMTTESRHTRNITLIEPIAPFQDAPGFYDHFPSSTFLQPDSLYFPANTKINTGF